MRDSVPSARYSPISNVLRQWKTTLIPIYRVYRLYDTGSEQGVQYILIYIYIVIVHEFYHNYIYNYT